MAWTLFSYRIDAGAEVDLVVDQGKSLLAVECKWGRQVAESDLKGLRSFESIADRPVDKVVLFRGDTVQKFSRGERAMPYQEFLAELGQH